MSCSELCHDQSTFPPPVTTSHCYNQNNSLGEILLYSVRRTIVKGTVTVRISYHKNHELKLLLYQHYVLRHIEREFQPAVSCPVSHFNETKM